MTPYVYVIVSNKMNRLKNSLNYFTKPISIVIGVFGFLGISSLFIIYSLFYTPEIYFQFSGEQSGFPIRLPKTKEFYIFTVNTKQNNDVLIERVKVYCAQFQNISINSRDPDAKLITTNDDEFSIALDYGEQFHIKKNNQYVLGFWYKLENPIEAFRLKFEVVSKIAEYDIGFPFSTFSPKSYKTTRVIDFSPIGFDAKDGNDFLRKYGIRLRPSEKAHGVGETIKMGYQAITEEGKGPTEIGVISIE